MNKLDTALSLKIFSYVANNSDNPFEGLKQIAVLSSVCKSWIELIYEREKAREMIFKPLFQRYASLYADRPKMSLTELEYSYRNKVMGTYVKDIKELKPASPETISRLTLAHYMGPGFAKIWGILKFGDSLILLDETGESVVAKKGISQELLMGVLIDAIDKEICIGNTDHTKIFGYRVKETIEPTWSIESPHEGKKILSLCYHGDYLFSFGKDAKVKGWKRTDGTSANLSYDVPNIHLEGYSYGMQVNKANIFVWNGNSDTLNVINRASGDVNEKRVETLPEAARFLEAGGTDTAVQIYEAAVNDECLAVVSKLVHESKYTLRIYRLNGGEIKEPIVTKVLSSKTPGWGISAGSLYPKYMTFAISQMQIEGDFVYMFFEERMDDGKFRKALLVMNWKTNKSYEVDMGKVKAINPDEKPFWHFDRVVDFGKTVQLFYFENGKYKKLVLDFAKDVPERVTKKPVPPEAVGRITSVFWQCIGRLRLFGLQVSSFVWKHRRMIVLVGLGLIGLAIFNRRLAPTQPIS